ncbi:purine permease [Sporolactobacillus sp. THM7-7]|nr:purine permease [Sporolactobacillus sp. THM7-7]
MEQKSGQQLLIGIDQKISVRQSILLGVQHVLAMDLYLLPIIIAGILGFSKMDTSFLIQMSFLAAGVATLIQTGFGMKLPIVQGPSYVPIGALTAIGSKLGLGAMVGSLIPGAILLAILGYPLRVFAKAVKKFIPSIVGGTVIVVVGFSLMPVAFNNIVQSKGSFGTNSIVALVSGGLVVASMMIGSSLKKRAGFFIRLTSVIIGLVGGTITASFFGVVDFSPVAAASWISLPQFFPFGAPVFDFNAMLTMIFIYLIILVETTGTWFVVGAVTDSKLTEERLNRGAVGEGIGCFIGSLFGGTPMTGYSSNAGIIAVTGVGSKRAIMASGAILVILGLIPKLSTIIACIPEAVINGVFAIVCIVIAMNGFRVIQNEKMDERNMMIIGIPLFLTVATMILPKDVLSSFPPLLNYIFSSGTAVGAIATVLLNIIIPIRKPSPNEVMGTHNATLQK